MKFIGLILYCAIMFQCKIPVQQNVTILSKLEKISLTEFIDAPLSKLVDSIGVKYTELVHASDPPCYLIAVDLVYDEETVVVVYFGQLSHQNNFVPGCQWDDSLLMKENVKGIKVFHKKQEIKVLGDTYR